MLLAMSTDLTQQQRIVALEMLDRGLDWLLALQEKDGGWHSTTYGALKQGAATTALVLYGLSHSPKRYTDRLEKPLREAFDFLKPGIEKTKTIACPDGTFDYPTYAAAHALAASQKARINGLPSLSQAEEAALAAYLIQAQLDERREFEPDSPHYGGWDLLGTQQVKGRTSETNVSLTFFALEALSKIETPEALECRKKALDWARRAQNLRSDGGFAFSGNKDSLANKAEWLDKEHQKPRSYGSPTCDGLRCLLLAGEKSESESVQAAAKWLNSHPHAKLVTGFETVREETGWPEGLRFYYYSGVADCLPHCNKEFQAAVTTDLIESLTKQQHKDGSWRNESSRMREDDPLIATTFAILSLCRLLI
jgi:hypothetical protein